MLISLLSCVSVPRECGIPEPSNEALVEMANGSLAEGNPGTELWVREIFRACQWG